MRLKLKEEPREWQKFTAAMAVALGAVTVLLWKRQMIPQVALIVVLTLLSLTLLLCLFRPRWFRSFYRAGMTLSTAIGYVVSTILLAMFFLFVLTPIGIIARLLGKDLLKTRRDLRATTYWRPAKLNNQYDREF
jgi:ABC-type sugar transport system permease subunit